MTTQRPVDRTPTANTTIPAGYRVRVWTQTATYVGTLVSVWLARDFAAKTPTYDPMVTLDVPGDNAHISFPMSQILTVEIFEQVAAA